MALLYFKEGVDPTGIKLELLDGLLCLAVEMFVAGFPLVVTALRDGKHKVGSLHYRGYAADLRARHVPPDQREPLLAKLRMALGQPFQILLEFDKNQVPHYHVEYDPHRDGGKTLP